MLCYAMLTNCIKEDSAMQWLLFDVTDVHLGRHCPSRALFDVRDSKVGTIFILLILLNKVDHVLVVTKSPKSLFKPFGSSGPVFSLLISSASLTFLLNHTGSTARVFTASQFIWHSHKSSCSAMASPFVSPLNTALSCSRLRVRICFLVSPV